MSYNLHRIWLQAKIQAMTIIQAELNQARSILTRKFAIIAIKCNIYCNTFYSRVPNRVQVVDVPYLEYVVDVVHVADIEDVTDDGNVRVINSTRTSITKLLQTYAEKLKNIKVSSKDLFAVRYSFQLFTQK